MEHRVATDADLDLLAVWNRHLNEDERAENLLDVGRRRGIGRRIVERLRAEVFPRGMRVTVEVLVHNERALAFWRAVGFADHAVAMTRRS